MSRCFPFPPPGYEKKARPEDDANILIKEKHKDKKHNKDKKDKEKKEKKEKKDKERSTEKHGEKKDRKRKHKDKDKNKEKEEKKDSEDKKIVSSSVHRNGEKLGPIGIQVDQTPQVRVLLELEKGVGNRNGPREIQSLDKSSVKELSIKSSGKESEGNHGGILLEGNQKFKDNREENQMPNGQSLKVIGKHLENGFLCNILSKEQKIVGAVCQEEKVSEKRKERKDKNKHKSSDSRGDKHKDGNREKKSKSKDKKEKKDKLKEEKVKGVSTPVQRALIENGNNSLDVQNDRGLFIGSNSNNGSLGKRKEPEMNGFIHGNCSPINKLPRPLSSSKVKQNGSRNDATNPEMRFTKEREAAEATHKLDAKASCSSLVSENGTKMDRGQTSNYYALDRQERQEAVNNHHHKANESLPSLQPSLGIGSKLEPSQNAMNSASKEQGMVTDHKLNKKVLPPLIAENGRKLESNQTSRFPSSERKGAVSKPKFDGQEMRINGLGLKKSDACSMRLLVPEQLKETVEAHLKPPHPDTKYLAEILTVPKVEWSDIDDQSWLFAREDHGGKKPKMDSVKLEESKKVWAEALQLESADVTALPYVIPY